MHPNLRRISAHSLGRSYFGVSPSLLVGDPITVALFVWVRRIRFHSYSRRFILVLGFCSRKPPLEFRYFVSYFRFLCNRVNHEYCTSLLVTCFLWFNI